VSHFRGLAAKDLLAIVSAGRVCRFPAEAMIFLQDDPCSGMFVLLSGKVNLCRLGPQGQQHILSILNPVIMFNEVAVLDGGTNPVTAIAVQDCMLWQIQCAAFQEILQRYPQIGLGLLRVMAARNRRMIAQFDDLTFRTVMARTAKLLLELSEQGHKTILRRDHSIDTLASRLATVPEAVSRALNYIKKQGAIELTRATIIVRQPDQLASLAQVDAPVLRE
jgi:CRP-like cAMP-binding protein